MGAVDSIVLRRRCCKIFSVVYHLVAWVVDRAAVRRVDRERVDVRVDDLRLRDLDRRERRAVWRVAESMAGSCDVDVCALHCQGDWLSDCSLVYGSQICFLILRSLDGSVAAAKGSAEDW